MNLLARGVAVVFLGTVATATFGVSSEPLWSSIPTADGNAPQSVWVPGEDVQPAASPSSPWCDYLPTRSARV